MDIDNIFTEEEKQIIDRLQEKIFKHFSSEQSNSKDPEELLKLDPNNEMLHPEKITDAPVEILFTIKAVVTEVDENGNPKETVDLLEKFYHIPITSGKNYKDYVDNFMNHFHLKLEQTCQELHKNE
jgi:hypothetical protein